MTAREVELHIDELVLHGFPGIDGYQVGDAVQHELAHLVAGDASRFKSDGCGSIDAGQFAMPGHSNSSSLGAHIARSVYGKITRGETEEV